MKKYIIILFFISSIAHTKDLHILSVDINSVVEVKITGVKNIVPIEDAVEYFPSTFSVQGDRLHISSDKNIESLLLTNGTTISLKSFHEVNVFEGSDSGGG